MTGQQATDYIRETVKVTPQQVVIAKSFLVKAHLANEAKPTQLVCDFLRHQGFERPNDPMAVNADSDLEQQLKRVCEYVIWLTAAFEGIWQLIHSGHFLSGSGFDSMSVTVLWTQRGNSMGLSLDDFTIGLPPIRRSRVASVTFLSDGDLFLQELDIPDMHAPIADALAECIRCFRHDLYLAAVVLLGRAAEGAWIEAGLTTAELSGTHKLQSAIASPLNSFAKKLRSFSDWVSANKDAFEAKYGIRLDEFRHATLWTDTVRDSRNAIHHQQEPATANTHEKVATLILGSVVPLRTLYRIVNTK
jgi:hypothetical protein